METPTISRRQARRDAMVILYQRDIAGAVLSELYDSLEKDRGYPPAEFTREDVEGVIGVMEELDSAIDLVSEGWPAHRMAALERNIIRLAVFEMKNRDDIPTEVSIDEAVELAKRYCSREAGALVNGILGKIATEARDNE
ncbi:MAG: transcription antitermination factor NusB [Thermoleophilia bacterium]